MSAIQLANYYYINQRFIDSLADYYNFDAIFYPNARRLVHFVLNQHYMQMSPSSTSPSDDCYMPFDPALISDDNHQTTSSIVAPSPPHVPVHLHSGSILTLLLQVNAIASAVVRPFMPFTLPPRSNTSSSSRTIRNFRNRLGTISTCDHATTTTVRGADDRASSSVGRCRSRSMFVTNTSWTDRLSNDTSIKSSNIDDHHRMMIEPNVSTIISAQLYTLSGTFSQIL